MENILINTINYGDGVAIKQLKIIDYGSSFFGDNYSDFTHVVPEYMPPEIL